MPLVPAAGRLSASAFGFARGVNFASFVTKANYAVPAGPTSQDVALGTAVPGNLAIIIVGYIATAGAPAGWTMINNFTDVSGYLYATYTRVLTGSEGGLVTVSGLQQESLVMYTAYRGPRSVAVVSTGSAVAGATTLVLPGFTKATACKGLLTWCIERVPTVTDPLVGPSGTTSRISPYSDQYFCGAASDLLVPPSYANGSNMVWTGMDTLNCISASGQILELS